ncbi:hypothetical protein HMPREF0663_12172 [Hoylesella oralis ATCC 33269]|uniref:Uncharacterized protein n=1 Tax=Hoylesella oralis ATCC 33269 TaxID=873533 RepID=E7RSA4_9BACT|nr:hypothetical protein HMPREF0663_12172 [Hoylesella oralis ATCC 33269]
MYFLSDIGGVSIIDRYVIFLQQKIDIMFTIAQIGFRNELS